jgi:hypothetical protein
MRSERFWLIATIERQMQTSLLRNCVYPSVVGQSVQIAIRPRSRTRGRSATLAFSSVALQERCGFKSVMLWLGPDLSRPKDAD